MSVRVFLPTLKRSIRSIYTFFSESGAYSGNTAGEVGIGATWSIHTINIYTAHALTHTIPSMGILAQPNYVLVCFWEVEKKQRMSRKTHVNTERTYTQTVI